MTVLRGIEVPHGQLMAADLVTWEAHYLQGDWIAEREGRRYADIERGRLGHFTLVGPGEVLFEMGVPLGETGARLVYRRRTTERPGEGRQSVVFIVGWAPDAVWEIDPEAGTMTAYDFAADPVPARPREGEHWGALLDKHPTRT